MKRLACILITVTALLSACGGGSSTTEGAGGNGAGGGDGGSGNTGNTGNGGSNVGGNKLFEVCSAYGEAYFASGCPPMQVNKDQIIAQCFGQGAAYENGCGQEFIAVYGCQAAAGFSCLNGNPYPNATCVTETTAFQMCAQALPCKDYCAKADAAGCAPASCVDACKAELSNVYCASDYSQLHSCQSQNLMCVDGKPSVMGCDDAVAGVGWCLANHGPDNDPCVGYCWMADALGCGDGCQTDCKAKLDDPKCGSYYSNVLSCAVDLIDLQVMCSGGKPVPTSQCDSSVMNYESCMTM